MDTVKTLIWDSIVRAAIQRLFILIPWLGWGPLGTIVSMLLMKFADVVYSGVKLSIQLEHIVLTNEKFKVAYNNATVKLHILAIDKGINSAEFKESRLEHQKALSDFVRFNIM